jgi:hypothetical protein
MESDNKEDAVESVKPVKAKLKNLPFGSMFHCDKFGDGVFMKAVASDGKNQLQKHLTNIVNMKNGEVTLDVDTEEEVTLVDIRFMTA